MIGLGAFLTVAAILFSVGLACILTRRNIIHVLMGVELIFNGAALNFVAFDHFGVPASQALANSGQVVALFVIVLAAAEAAVALALVMVARKIFHSVQIESLSNLKG